MQNDDFQRALETIKLRAPIEDVVRERVPALKRTGASWKACCPFHDERTPSFVVTPTRGTWRCFGACGTGGDQFSFVQRFDNVGFLDAVEILAARTGVTLPKRSRDDGAASEARNQLQDVLERAARYYRGQMRTAEGQAAVRYLKARGLSEATAEAFTVGYAPSAGSAFVEEARQAGIELSACEKVGLVRRSAEGRPFDFFRGRLMIPIRDVKGRVVGFGARTLADGDGPKYVNTAETDLFKKGSLVYALDRALPHVRKSAHVVLVEGYTDVMAAHQCGFGLVVAVLGTATTDDHAALLRRTGARRISLVFDGDEAGRKAAYKALHGLLPLEAEIDVVSLRGGDDPCDLLVREGAAAFGAQLELARGWFEFLLEGLRGKTGVELSRETDIVFELLARLSKPVHRDSRLASLADSLGLPRAGVFEQFAALTATRSRRAPPVRSDAVRSQASEPVAPVPPADSGTAVPSQPTAPVDPWVRRAYGDLLGALLIDASVFPLLRSALPRCPDPELARIFAVIAELYADTEATIDEGSVMNALGEDPARDRVVPAAGPARSMGADFEARTVVEDILGKLASREREARSRYDLRLLSEIETAHLRSGSVHEAAHDPQGLEVARRIDAAQRRANASEVGAIVTVEHPIPTEVEDSNHHG